jgi:hypothetical protein
LLSCGWEGSQKALLLFFRFQLAFASATRQDTWPHRWRNATATPPHRSVMAPLSVDVLPVYPDHASPREPRASDSSSSRRQQKALASQPHDQADLRGPVNGGWPGARQVWDAGQLLRLSASDLGDRSPPLHARSTCFAFWVSSPPELCSNQGH